MLLTSLAESLSWNPKLTICRRSRLALAVYERLHPGIRELGGLRLVLGLQYQIWLGHDCIDFQRGERKCCDMSSVADSRY